MEAGVRHPDESAEFFTDERCHILELSGGSADPGLSIARARVEPGVTTQLHVLDIAERYLVVAGEGDAEVGGQVTAVRPGDVVLIPAGTPQRIVNTGGADLVFYCLCTPAWTPDTYRSLE